MDGVEIGNGLKEITLDFPDEGDFQLCVTAYIGNPQSGSICDQDGPRCITMLVSTTPQLFGTPRTLCSERIPFNWHGRINQCLLGNIVMNLQTKRLAVFSIPLFILM
ncbi:MAG: hypothetical protein IPG87_15150 [Saprospiraceae bacterium]|nr:hypothetical protein [Candidatus Vicinibacter affinis]